MFQLFLYSNKVTRANELTNSSSIQICVWVSDHLCCKHTVFLFHGTFSHSLCHAFAIPVAPLASLSAVLPDLNTLQIFSPAPFPRFLRCLSTLLACQLGKREAFPLVWFRRGVMCCCSWHTKGLCCGAPADEEAGRAKDASRLRLPISIACGNFVFLILLPNCLVEVSWYVRELLEERQKDSSVA